MKRFRFFYVLLAGMSIFSKFSICQMPDFSQVPNLHAGDSLNIVSLINSGVEIKKGKTICWFPKDSLSKKRMKGIADTLNRGIIAAEKFIKASLSTQEHLSQKPYTFYFRVDTFVSHASLANFVSIPFWRIKEGKAPWLHEALHEMLSDRENNWFQKTVTDDYFNKNMPLWLSEGLPDYIAMKVSNRNKLAWYDVFSRSLNPNVDSVFTRDMKSKNGQYILAYIGAKGVMPELSSKDRQQYAPGFYHGSCSFVQFIADHYGLELLLDAISSFQKEHETIEIKTGKSITELKNAWIKQIESRE